jgi:hypothetical protein
VGRYQAILSGNPRGNSASSLWAKRSPKKGRHPKSCAFRRRLSGGFPPDPPTGITRFARSPYCVIPYSLSDIRDETERDADKTVRVVDRSTAFAHGHRGMSGRGAEHPAVACTVRLWSYEVEMAVGRPMA